MKRQRKIAKGEVVKIKGANLGKFIYSEKAKKFYEISTVDLTVTGQIYVGDFAKFCGLLSIYELERS